LRDFLSDFFAAIEILKKPTYLGFLASVPGRVGMRYSDIEGDLQ